MPTGNNLGDGLVELAERCEAATGPDRAIDRLIANAWGSGAEFQLQEFTASLDAAMTLVPKGWWLQHLGHRLDGWQCLIETNGPPSHSVDTGRKNGVATAALALCAAAIRARASQIDGTMDNG